jgi:hypothetical protein
VVSVWDRKPTADELLEKRLASGWRPVASQLRDGNVVEGYATCVFQANESGGE